MSGSDKEHEEQLQAPQDTLAAAIEPTRSHDSAEAQFSEGVDSLPIDEKKNGERIGQRLKEGDSSGSDNDQLRVSATTPEEAAHKKPWYKKTNPLRWGGIPPVPEEKIVSREGMAGFWSKLTFNWMTPLMTVSGSWVSLEACLTSTLTITCLTQDHTCNVLKTGI